MQTFSWKSMSAVLWELWRVSRFELLVRFAFVAAVMLLILCLSKGFDEIQWLVIRGVVLVLLGISCAFSTTWTSDLDNQHAGFTFRLGYTRPISTLQLVLVPMAYSVASAMAGYILCALFAQVVLGQPLPLIGPTLFFGCNVCVLVCVAWSSTQSLEKILGIFLASMAIIGTFLVRHNMRPGDDQILLALGQPGYFDLVWYEYLYLGLVSGAAVGITVISVGRQRCGEGLRWSILPIRMGHAVLGHRWLIVAKEWLEASLRPNAFSGPVLAQYWFEARRSGTLLFFASTCTLLVLAFVVIVPFSNNAWGGVHSLRIWLGAIVCTPLLYQLMAIEPLVGLRHQQGSTQLSLFDATRPLRCDQLIAIKLMVVAGWSLFGFMQMVLVAVVHTTLAGQWRFWSELNESLLSAVLGIVASEWGKSVEGIQASAIALREISMLGWLAALFNILLLYCCSTSMMLTLVLWMGKHSKVMMAFVAVGMLHVFVYFWDVSHGRPLKNLWLAYGYLLPLAMIALSLLALKAAIAAGYLSSKYFYVAMGSWLVYVVTTSLVLMKILSVVPLDLIHPTAWLFAIACLLAPLATTATAPLALAAYRHA